MTSHVKIAATTMDFGADFGEKLSPLPRLRINEYLRRDWAGA
jgi:hypothetical protein